MDDLRKQASAHLRTLREHHNLSLQQAAEEIVDCFGKEGRVRYQQISRIEKGEIDKPSIVELIRLGAAYGLSPDDIGEVYGLWPRSSNRALLDERLRRAIEVSRIPTDRRIREDMLNWVEFAVMQALARAREQQHEGREVG